MQLEQPRKTRIRYDCPSCGFTAMGSAGGVLFCHTEGCDTGAGWLIVKGFWAAETFFVF
jgi:hypothetical protein